MIACGAVDRVLPGKITRRNIYPGTKDFKSDCLRQKEIEIWAVDKREREKEKKE